MGDGRGGVERGRRMVEGEGRGGEGEDDEQVTSLVPLDHI